MPSETTHELSSVFALTKTTYIHHTHKETVTNTHTHTHTHTHARTHAHTHTNRENSADRNRIHKETVTRYIHTCTQRQRETIFTTTDRNTYFATASSTLGSCSHFFKASTLLVFLCGCGSRKIASDHNIPEVGHS